MANSLFHTDFLRFTLPPVEVSPNLPAEQKEGTDQDRLGHFVAGSVCAETRCATRGKLVEDRTVPVQQLHAQAGPVAGVWTGPSGRQGDARWTPTLVSYAFDLLRSCCAKGGQNTVSPCLPILAFKVTHPLRHVFQCYQERARTRDRETKTAKMGHFILV